MKRHWRLGVLLGVSVALLLAGGVALAQTLGVAVDPDCFVCTPRADWPPSEGQFVTLTFSGYDTSNWLCGELMMENTLWNEGCWEPELPGPPCTATLAVRCEDLYVDMADTCEGVIVEDVPGSFRVSDLPPAIYGNWTWTLWELDEGEKIVAGPVEATFRFAEVCEVEFVPEPGSILLLGSGLAGLAGYATLRWRARQ
jgi:hypothetical protein